MSTARILYGEDFAESWKKKIKTKNKLLIVTSGDDTASQVYVKNKVKLAEGLGIKVRLFHVKSTADILALKTHVSRVLPNEKIIIQKPYAKEFAKELANIQHEIPPYSDVDGLNPNSNYTPCTARAVMEMLKEYDLTSKHVVIVGRSDLVGKPLINLCLEKNATVTSCNSYTKDLKAHTRMADVLISAVGKAKFITEEYVKDGAIVIDVGINRDENGKLCGDVDFENVVDKCIAISPVPKGVGVMTCVMLAANVGDM